MATKKQKRRRAKEQRHDYMWVDDAGNEVDPDGEPTADRNSRGESRVAREPQAPSWRRTFRRGLIFAPIMLATVFLLSPDLPLTTKVTQTLLLVAIFVPFSYFIDRLFYRSHLRKQRQRGA
jgi:hypothetical protein